MQSELILEKAHHEYILFGSKEKSLLIMLGRSGFDPIQARVGRDLIYIYIILIYLLC